MKPFIFTYAPNWPWLPQISLTLIQLMPFQWGLYHQSPFLWQCLKSKDPLPRGSQRNLSFGLAGPNDPRDPSTGKGLRLLRVGQALPGSSGGGKLGVDPLPLGHMGFLAEEERPDRARVLTGRRG